MGNNKINYIVGYSIAVARFLKTDSCASDPVLLGMPRFATEKEGHTGSVCFEII
jgi:hypothetical protein